LTVTGDADGNGPEARLDYPSGLTVLNDAVYVADKDNHDIRKLSSATLANGVTRALIESVGLGAPSYSSGASRPTQEVGADVLLHLP